MKKAAKRKTKALTKTNPNGVNQYTPPDPRQAFFLSYFLNPESETFSNCYQSALRAKYSEEYAKVITSQMPDWLSEKLKEMELDSMLFKAKRNLDLILDVPHVVQAMGAFGPVYEKIETRVKGKNGRMKKQVKKIPIMKVDSGILKIKKDTSEFVAERLDKANFGKEKPQGGKFQFNFVNMKGDKDQYQ
jgi:hypothetical protein